MIDLRAELLKEHSKKQCISIVQWVGEDQVRFDQLFHLFLNDEYRVVQRAAWPISYCVIDHPSLINKHWKKLIDNLQKPAIHDAVKRNSIRLMQNMMIPKKYQGDILDLCLKYVASPQETVAVKSFSLKVLGNLAKEYPEIIPEIKLLIEDQMPHQTAAFRSSANKLLKAWAKQAH